MNLIKQIYIFCFHFCNLFTIGLTDNILASNFAINRLSSGNLICERNLPNYQLTTESRIKCLIKCKEKGYCVSVNWRQETKLCEVYTDRSQKYFLEFAACENYLNSALIPLTNIPVLHMNFIYVPSSCVNQFPQQTGWLVIQRRCVSADTFNRPWYDYQVGFGSFEGEFWIGNEFLHHLTLNPKTVRFDFVDSGGVPHYAVYSSFQVGSSATNYVLSVSGYSGDAGDHMYYNSGYQFSTYDADHDIWPYNCPNHCLGGGWFQQCTYVNFNGMPNGPTTNQHALQWGSSYYLKFFQISVKY